MTKRAREVWLASYGVYVDDSLFTQVADMTPAVTLSAGEVTYTVEGLAKGVQYYFAVVARDISGNVNTSVTPESVVPTDVIPPEDVTGLRAESTDSSLLIRWTHAADTAGDLAGYRVYVGSDDQGTEVASTVNSFEQTGLDAATAYLVRVTSVDQDGNENAGVSLTAVTLLPNPEGVVATP